MSAPLREYEYEKAKAALVAGGFTNARAIEILHTRQALLDAYAMAALQGLLAVDWSATDEEIVEKAFTCARIALRTRAAGRDYRPANGRDSERP